MADSAVKKHYDYAQQQIDEQAILDKYNAATVAQFNVQREQNRQAENQFYNEMYNTQKTAMDTIRQSNAAAVASGASRGVQAAQELSSLLGLQQESVASATELAKANRQTAQEETAAVLENVLNAYKQANEERSQVVSQGIEAESVAATKEANVIANIDALNKALQTGTASYLTTLSNLGYDYSQGSTEGAQSLSAAISGLEAVTADDINSLWSRSFGHESTAAINKTDKKVIFLHLRGSHAPYNTNYPSEFNIFKGF